MKTIWAGIHITLILASALFYSCHSARKKFDYNIRAIPKQVAKQMRLTTWRQTCPIALKDLSYIKLSYYGFDGNYHKDGVLIVHKELAREVVKVFEHLYNQKFPIKSIKPMYQFKGDDQASMAANNTSAFNCRTLTGSLKDFSKHSFGTAIDINPLLNPYVKGHFVFPSEGTDYLDRSNPLPGMILEGGAILKIFAKYGWEWGGDWTSFKDYHHFEKNLKAKK